MSMRMRPAEFCLDLARPRREKLVVPARYRREEVMQLERHLRRVGPRQPQHGGRRYGRHHRGQKRAAGKSHGPLALRSLSDAAQLRRDGRSSFSEEWGIPGADGAAGADRAAAAVSALLSRDRRS